MFEEYQAAWEELTAPGAQFAGSPLPIREKTYYPGIFQRLKGRRVTATDGGNLSTHKTQTKRGVECGAVGDKTFVS